MRRTALLLSGLLLLALWLVLGLRAERETSVGEATAAGADEGRNEEARLVPVGAPDAVSVRAAVVEAPPAEVAEELEPVAPVSSMAGTGLRLLRGRLLDADTRTPLGGYALRLSTRYRGKDGEVRVGVVTDGAGVFEIALAPGEYMLFHAQDLAPDHEAGLMMDECAIARTIEPYTFELPEADGAVAAPHEATFLARHPPAVLDVLVELEDGKPAAGASVLFWAGFDDPPMLDPRVRANARGRARLSIWSPLSFRDGLLRAWDDQERVSDLLPIEAPFVPGLRRLVLAPGATLEVDVTDPAGLPVAGQRTGLTSLVANGPRAHADTDARGRARFGGLFAGRYRLGVWRVGVDGQQVQELALLRGETRRVAVALPDDERRVAVAGRVVNEAGAPLAEVELTVFPKGRWPLDVKTDAAGAFIAYGDPCESVLVRANLSAEGDVFEPGELHAGFGTTGVLFTRVRTADRVRFEVKVVDAATGEELPHFVATIDRGPGTEEWSNSYAPRRAFDLMILPETRWRISSAGYVTRALALRDELAGLAPSDRLRVALEPGLDTAFLVLDADTDAPLKGVLLQSASGRSARSDAGGRVHLRASDWEVYTATKEGYESEAWDPEDYVLWDWGPLHLTPAED